LIQLALAQSGISPAQTLVVGDDHRDLAAAERAGVKAALVRTGKGRRTESSLHGAPVPTYDDLPQLADAILGALMSTR
jgi:phosphoglycolate phosphatase-like HAD superfamily hydrolase